MPNSFLSQMTTVSTPDDAIKVLMEGNERFANNLRFNRNLLDLVEQTENGQQPFAAILSCMDSRASVEVIFDQGIGDVFSLRVAGNVVSEDVLGSLEYAVCAVGVKLIMVMGHTSCGAIKGACDHFELGNLTGLLRKIKPAMEMEQSVRENRNGGNKEFVNKVASHNVLNSIQEILQRSELIREAVGRDEVRIVPAMYNISNGRVELQAEMAAV